MPSLNKYKREFERRLKEERVENRPIVRKNMSKYNKIPGVREGDFVKAPNGKMYRIAYIWRDETGAFQWQVADPRMGGSYYLGDGYVSYSGSLDSGFDDKTRFRNLGYKRNGRVWIFRRNIAEADNAVDYDDVKFRVFKASKNPKV